jgi:Uma2 family endonuclease
MSNLNQVRSNYRVRESRSYEQHIQRSRPSRLSEPQPLEHHYTYDEYAALTDGIRYELIDGTLYAMASPTIQHQAISKKIVVQFDAFLEDKTCEVFYAPLDVRLLADPDSPDDGTYKPDDKTVVQPDILVVCDKGKLHHEAVRGVPDLVIEILSPSNTKHDKELKYKIYQEAGVREYWIVDPDAETVTVYNLKDGVYAGITFEGRVSVPSKILDGCVIDMEKVFRYAKE